MPAEPYCLAIVSHKGGTGRTTTAAALAAIYGRRGYRVALVDATPDRAAGLIACDEQSYCSWPGVTYLTEIPSKRSEYDLAIVDAPPLLSRAVMPILEKCQGAVVTVTPNPVSLRTVPLAAAVLAAAREWNPRLELLGVLVTMAHAGDVIQTGMVERMRTMDGPVLVEPCIPDDEALRDWPLRPGTELPSGPGATTYKLVTSQILELAHELNGLELAANGVRS